jgi:hypothetical protein
MAMSLPVIVLTFLGAIIAVLGFFAGGSIPLVIVGLAAIAGPAFSRFSATAEPRLSPRPARRR